MAIYSLNLKSIGRTTHAAGTAGAHVLYIAREGAAPQIVAEGMPTDPDQARAWMNRAEAGDRKNARVIDKVRIALPRELTPTQRMTLVQDFARELTGDRVPWFAAIHAEGKDAHNPHCHLVIRDRDLETGKRVVRLSDSPRDRAKAGLEPKAVEHVRALWEVRANQALESAGHDVRIDRRSLEAQGIDREPTIHIGPQAAHVEAFVERPRSKIRETGNGRSIDYPQIDAGRTRKDRHAEIVDLNLEKAARSPDFRTREMAKLQKHQAGLDRRLEESLIAEARERTKEIRSLRAGYREELTALREARRGEEKALKAHLGKSWVQGRDSLTERHRGEKEALRADHSTIGARLKRVFDLTGRTKRRQEEEREALKARQKEERAALVERHREEKAEGSEKIASRHRIMARELKAAHAPGRDRMAERHRVAELEADRQRQMRAAEREQAERRAEQVIGRAEKVYGSMQSSDRDRGYKLSR